MSFSHLLRKSGQSSFAHSDPTDAETNPHWQASADDPDDPPQHRHASESTSAIHLPWRKKRPSAVDGQSQLASPTPLIPKAQSPPSDGGMAEMTPPAIGPVPDTLTEAWDAVKDNPKIPNMSRELDAVGARFLSLDLVSPVS
jgi:hypothetical protein